MLSSLGDSLRCLEKLWHYSCGAFFGWSLQCRRLGYARYGRGYVGRAQSAARGCVHSSLVCRRVGCRSDFRRIVRPFQYRTCTICESCMCYHSVQKLLNWRWNFWIQLIAGVCVQAAHFFVPETRSTVLVTREARRRRKNGETNLYSAAELEGSQLSVRHVLMTWARPVRSLACC
jgi:hypothetical protein